MDRHLQAVPDTLSLKDDLAEHRHESDEWKQGWRACREILGNEWAVWYARGVAARPAEGIRLDIFLAATGAFIAGFVVAVALTA